MDIRSPRIGAAPAGRREASPRGAGDTIPRMDSAARHPEPSTGLPALDRALQGIRPGDNIVWQVDSIEDYRAFVAPFVAHARRSGHPFVYFRFASHPELVPEGPGVRVVRLDPREGFEQFITTIHRVIEETGNGGRYVFDTYSELSLNCYSDRMVGNFFKLTCPFLYRLETIAYFSLIRNFHSDHAATPIKETTQIFLDVYRHEGSFYVHPLKVFERYSPTIYMLHRWAGDDFVPVKESSLTAEVLTGAPWAGLQSASYRMVGPWDKQFMHAEEMLQAYRSGAVSKETADASFRDLLRLSITKDERMLPLAERFLTLEDVIYIWKRTIGTGMIGGKAVGMLVARAVLRRADPRWARVIELHDSFHIGSDVFYSYLVQNDCWLIRQKQKDASTFLDGVEEARGRILHGDFPDYILKRFADMLDYYGQSPIIVRSSSLLEDNFGNAFAGKYDSVFCPNQGTREERLTAFLDAVRAVYASAMSVEALSYRAKRGVLDRDEQMALLVQRVAGSPYGGLFFPHVAGVGFSFNPYVWNEAIDPEAGMIRIVFGLGTRAVERIDDDYARVVALNAPSLRVEASFAEVRRHAQRRVDVIDVEANRFVSMDFVDVVRRCPDLPVEMFAAVDREAEERQRERGRGGFRPWVLTFERVFAESPLIGDVGEIFRTLRDAYGTHVDVEFTTHFLPDGTYKINLLQCRPLQVQFGGAVAAGSAPEIAERDVLMRAHGGVIGHGRSVAVDRIVFVVPSAYGRLGEADRHAVARLVGRVSHHDAVARDRILMLIGPGRWGTSTPSLGVPVTFGEIHTASVLCEIDTMHEGLVPDLSLGTHFFHEMVEMNILYVALFHAAKENLFREDALMGAANRLADVCPDEARWAGVVRVLYAEDLAPGMRLRLHADPTRQVATLFVPLTS